MPASGPPSVAYSAGVEQPVLVHLVEAEGDVERRRLGVPVLAGEVVEQLVRGDGQVAHAAFEEISGQRRLGRDDQLGRLRRRGSLAEQGAEPAEVLLVGTLSRAQLGNGETKHTGNVYRTSTVRPTVSSGSVRCAHCTRIPDTQALLRQMNLA